MRFPLSVRFLALFTSFVAGISAQQKAPEISVPRVIRYAAVLPDGARDGAAGVIFSIYREELGGSPVWSEVQNVRG
jgi:hypothetical protein